MMHTADLPLRIPEDLVDEFVKRLPFVHERLRAPRLSADRTRVEFELPPEAADDAAAVAAAIVDIAGRMCSRHRPVLTRTLASRAELPTAFSADPHTELQRSGEITVFGAGRVALGARLTALMRALDQAVLEFAAEIGAAPHLFPTLIGAETLDRCRYFQNFPTGLGFVSHLREDHARLQEFSRTARWDGQGVAVDPASLSRVECLLSPAVCFHHYAALSGQTLGRLSAITAVGKCFRYESANMQGLERLWDFTMREVIFVGTAMDAAACRQRSIEACVSFLEEWGLAYEITTATDPFFADTFATQSAFQQGFELKFEVLTPLPYSGRRIAVGSINYHQDFFGRSFGITAGDAPAHTACLAFGLERLVLAFVAQHGTDPAGWPARVRERLG